MTSSLRTMASAELSLSLLAVNSRVRSITVQFEPARLGVASNFTGRANERNRDVSTVGVGVTINKGVTFMSADIPLSPDRWEREFALKQADLHLRELQGGLWRSPVFLGLIAAALALFGNMYATWSQNKSAARQAHVKAQSDLVIEAIKTSDPKLAARNLLFLVRLGLLDDPDGKMQVVLSQ